MIKKPKHIILRICLPFLLTGWASLVHAQDLHNGHLALGIGTTGIQAEVSQTVSSKWSIAGSLNYFYLPASVNRQVGPQDVVLSAGVQYLTLGAFGNYHISRASSGRSWKIRAGLVYNNNPVYKARTTPTGTYSFGDFQLSDAQKGYVDVKVRVSSIQPAAGIGYGGRFSKDDRWGLGFDAGILYHGKPKVTMQGTGVFTTSAADEQQLEDNISGYRWFPQLTIKLQYYIL